MPTTNFISPETRGVDMRQNPLFLGTRFVHHAANLSFSENRIRTRPGFLYHETGVSGKFHGATRYQPARGISFKPFGASIDAIAMVVDGDTWLMQAGCGCAKPVCNPVRYTDVANLFQAEQYLVVQSPTEDTTWYEGGLCMVRSPGMSAKPERVSECLCEIEVEEKKLDGGRAECCYERISYEAYTAVPKDCAETPEPNSHDTLIWENHRNFLINGAGLGVYAHGRVHQEGPFAIHVSDIIHKRGNKIADDILLMEEQALASYGPPLSAQSQLGNLRALATLPRENTADGEGALVAYFEHGVVAFDTFQFPRETRFTAAGELMQEGWGNKQMISHLLNSISAVGRYAVATMPRDHLFRSRFGIHFLRIAMGGESIRDETVNIMSAPVAPLLDEDRDLLGAAVGHWVAGSRVFATTGLDWLEPFTFTSMGEGFVSWNKAASYTVDNSIISAWEGVWLPDFEVAGIHKFEGLGDGFGFLASARDSDLLFATVEPDLEEDFRDGEGIPIEWEVVTGAIALAGLSRTATVSEGSIDLILQDGSEVTVEGRSDVSGGWREWKTIKSCGGGKTLQSESLGMPPKRLRDATWLQLRVTGKGYAEILRLDASFSDGRSKGGGRSSCIVAPSESISYLRLRQHPSLR